MVAFVASVALAALMLAVVFRVGRTREPGTPLTWGEAFAAGVFILLLMILVYGIIPHQWLTYADSQLGWRPDKKGIPTGPIANLEIAGKTVIQNHVIWGGEQDIAVLGFLGEGRGRVMVNAQILRDIIATTIYVIAVAGNMWLWLWWQKRKPSGEKSAKSGPVRESAFGRPIAEQA